MAAYNVTNVNFGFKQFVTAVVWAFLQQQILYDHEQHFNTVP